MFTEQNTQRVERQKQQQIFVIVGNPPYNAWQMNENDNNKNRKYSSLDARVTDTYASHSRAKLLTSLNDPYVKAFRWASDRISKQGIVAFVSNNSFIDQLAFDGVRRALAQEFDLIYILDLGGNVRKNPKLSGTTHNVFGIQVGVSINLFVRNPNLPTAQRGIYYAAAERDWRKEEKYQFLEQRGRASAIDWKAIQPDRQVNWLREGLVENYAQFLSIGSKRQPESDQTIFGAFSHGINTARDAQVYNFNIRSLQETTEGLCETYNAEVDRWIRAGQTSKIDDFVDYSKIKWSRNLKRNLRNKVYEKFESRKLRQSLYRPFAAEHVYLSEVLVDELGRMLVIFPNFESEEENVCISVSAVSAEKPFLALTTNRISNYHLAGAGAGTQCFPFYTYAEDGTHRRENITDWALEQFRAHYHDPSIIKWDIFHYIYAVLHHPEYRERYAANLRRELPRIPFATSTPCHPEAAESLAKRATPNEGSMQLAGSAAAADESIGPSAREERGPQDDRDVFRAFVKAGQRLAEIHVHYEQQPEYKLTKVEKKGEKLDYRVTKMKLSKDKTTLVYNQFLTLSAIPKETYDYRLGNRSALEWVIDQYQVSTDKRSGITNDPNRPDDPQYILRLIGQVITVSLETVAIMRTLPPLGLPQ